jgi:hypothetical protein
LGVADLLTDALAYARLQSGEIKVPNDAYRAVYAVELCFGVVTTVLSLGYRLRNARLMRAYVLEHGKQDQKASVSATRKQAQQHEWELARKHTAPRPSRRSRSSASSHKVRSMHEARVVLSVQREIGTAALAGLPMSIIYCCLIVFDDKATDRMVLRLFPCCTKRGKLQIDTRQELGGRAGACFVARLGAHGRL